MNIVSSMSPITFIDTTIWLYAFSESQPRIKSDSAKALLKKTAKITLSTQVVNEVAVNLLRKFGSDEQTMKNSRLCILNPALTLLTVAFPGASW